MSHAFLRGNSGHGCQTTMRLPLLLGFSEEFGPACVGEQVLGPVSRDFESLPDEELVQRTRDGDAQAFDALVRRYLRPALAVALEFADGTDDAEDLVQETFHRTLRKLGRFDERRPFRPWFFSILRNSGRNLVARRNRWRTVPLPESLVAKRRSPFDDASSAEIRERLSAAIERLPEMQRGCFRLYDVEGFTGEEVADMLGIAPGTVRTHLHRARQSLRESLRPTDEGPRVTDEGPRVKEKKNDE